MRRKWKLIGGAVSAVLICLGALTACNGVRETPEMDARIASLTIFPVTAMGQQHPRFGEALGLLLEKEGFRGGELAQVSFRPDQTDDFEATAAAFGAFVAKKELNTDYALYCEFDGTPEGGVLAVREAIVHRDGAVLWTDVQEPGSKAFKRFKPNNPMTCCMLAADRVRPLLIQATSTEVEQEGKMTQQFRRSSGIPDDAVFEAMKKRQQVLRGADRETTVTVYPVRVGDKTDRSGAEQLVRHLNKRFSAKVAERPLRFSVEHSTNQQAVLWDMADKFRSHAKNSDSQSDYDLFVDVIMTPSGRVWAVHVAVCDAVGEYVVVDFQNSHHSDFARISPESVEDSVRLAAVRIEHYLK